MGVISWFINPQTSLGGPILQLAVTYLVWPCVGQTLDVAGTAKIGDIFCIQRNLILRMMG